MRTNSGYEKKHSRNKQVYDTIRYEMIYMRYEIWDMRYEIWDMRYEIW